MENKKSGLRQHFAAAVNGIMVGIGGTSVGLAAIGGPFVSPVFTATALLVAAAGLGVGLYGTLKQENTLKHVTFAIAATIAAATNIALFRPLLDDEMKKTIGQSFTWEIPGSPEQPDPYATANSTFCRSKAIHPGYKFLCN